MSELLLDKPNLHPAVQTEFSRRGGQAPGIFPCQGLDLLAVLEPSKNASAFQLGPPVERIESGYPLFSVVYFSRGPPPEKKKGSKGTIGGPGQVHRFRSKKCELILGINGDSLMGIKIQPSPCSEVSDS